MPPWFAGKERRSHPNTYLSAITKERTLPPAANDRLEANSLPERIGPKKRIGSQARVCMCQGCRPFHLVAVRYAVVYSVHFSDIPESNMTPILTAPDHSDDSGMYFGHFEKLNVSTVRPSRHPLYLSGFRTYVQRFHLTGRTIRRHTTRHRFT